MSIFGSIASAIFGKGKTPGATPLAPGAPGAPAPQALALPRALQLWAALRPRARR